MGMKTLCHVTIIGWMNGHGQMCVLMFCTVILWTLRKNLSCSIVVPVCHYFCVFLCRLVTLAFLFFDHGKEYRTVLTGNINVLSTSVYCFPPFIAFRFCSCCYYMDIFSIPSCWSDWNCVRISEIACVCIYNEPSRRQSQQLQVFAGAPPRQSSSMWPRAPASAVSLPSPTTRTHSTSASPASHGLTASTQVHG